jgi:thiopurine S-methyltransferase
MKNLNKDYWENRYETNQIGWDIGYISDPLKAYIDQCNDKEIKILIPGAGQGYEFDYLISQGFSDVYIIDIAKQPLEKIKARHPAIDIKFFIQNDFFELNDTFDLVIEQTFFCALHPSLRKKYATQMAKLLKNKGTLAGVLFNFPLSEEGPPFGGSIDAYRDLFQDDFYIKNMNRCYNSIKPRADKELFVILKKQ